MPLSLLFQVVMDPNVAKPAAEVLMAVAVGVSTWLGKRGESRTREQIGKEIADHAASTTAAIAAHSDKVEQRFDAIDGGIRDLRGIVVGPDGKNGLRQRIEEIRTDVKAVQATCTQTSIDSARMDERVTNNERRLEGIEARERDK